MARSKRNTIVTLSKVKKKNRESKKKLIDDVRNLSSCFKYIYIIEILNQKNNALKEVRDHFKPGRIIMGKNKVLQIAFGSTPENELDENIHQISKLMYGERGLLFTNEEKSEVETYMNNFRPSEFCRPGFSPQETILLTNNDPKLKLFAPSVEPYLRKLGLSTQLKNGEIELLRDAVLCTKDKPVTSEQAQLLKLFNYPLSKFEMKIVGLWSEGKFNLF